MIDPIIASMVSNAKRSTYSRVATMYENDNITFPKIVIEPLSFGAKKTDFDSHYAIVNYDDEEHPRVVQVVTDAYSLLRHEDVIAAADKAMTAQYGKNFSKTTGMIGGGDKMIVQYKMESCPIRLRGRNDEAYPTLILKNSYDLGWSASAMGGIFRLWCSNGAYYGEAETSKKKHTAQITPEFVKATMKNIVSEIPQIEARMKEWQNIEIKHSMRIGIDALGLNDGEAHSLLYLGEKTTGLHVEAHEIEDKNGKPKTVWTPEADTTKYDLWNLMTEFATHRVTNPIRRDTISTNIHKVFNNDKFLLPEAI